MQSQFRNETSAQRQKRMAWFHEARFGMFIHWGLYAVPGGIWNGREVGGIGEWIMNSAKIPVAEYEKLQSQFNPVRFNATQWARIAKDAGMKYLVITSKHHDGFCLWNSKQTDWDVANTPFRRDILKELAQACRKEGVRLCFYHSIMDWHHPDYLPRRPWDPRPEPKPNFDRYIAYLKAQLKELITEYGPLGILWFDGEWENTWTHEMGKELYDYVRSLQPDIIVNNRVDKGRNGMQGLTAKGDYAGDYGTPEQEIPPSGLPGIEWESCMTMNDTWGFKKNDTRWKSARTLLENLIDIASKGGNYLLNVGPTPEGEIPAASVERLAEMGKWLRRNGTALYGTTASPFPRPLAWGRVTQKPGKLYLHVFDTSKPVELPPLGARVTAISTLAGKKKVAYTQTEAGITIALPDALKAETIPVLVAEVSGAITAPTSPELRQSADGRLELQAADAHVRGATARYEPDKRCIGFWTNPKDSVYWEVTLTRPGTYRVEMELACERVTAGTPFTLAVGKAKLSSHVPATGDWTTFQTFPIGTITITQTGKQIVLVLPQGKPVSGVMNLRRVLLTPA